MLTIILELCYELSQASETFNIKIPSNPKLFQLRNKILEVSFSGKINQTDDEVAYELIKEVRKLNSILRCFGVYKTKKRKSWNLNKKKFQSVLKIINWEDGQEKEAKKKPLAKRLIPNFNEYQKGCEQRNGKCSQFEMQYYENSQAMLYWMNVQYLKQQMKIQAQWFQYNQFYQECHYETSLMEKQNGSPEVTKEEQMGCESENNIRFYNLEGYLMKHEEGLMNGNNESFLLNWGQQMKTEGYIKEQQIV